MIRSLPTEWERTPPRSDLRLALPVVCGCLLATAAMGLATAATGNETLLENPLRNGTSQIRLTSAVRRLSARDEATAPASELPAPKSDDAEETALPDDTAPTDDTEPPDDTADDEGEELPAPDDAFGVEPVPDDEGDSDRADEEDESQAGRLPQPLRDVPFRPIRPSGESPDDIATKRFAEIGVAVPGAPCGPEAWFAYHWVAPGLCHRPLYFEEPNLERHGRTYHCLQPIVSGVHFFGTVPLLPYRIVVEPCHECNYTYGHRRPGSLAAMERHWLPFRKDAAFVEAAVIAGLIIVVP